MHDHKLKEMIDQFPSLTPCFKLCPSFTCETPVSPSNKKAGKWFIPATRLAKVVLPVPGFPANTRWRGVSSFTLCPRRFLLSFCSCVLVKRKNCCFSDSSPIKSFIAFSILCKTASWCTIVKRKIGKNQLHCEWRKELYAGNRVLHTTNNNDCHGDNTLIRREGFLI